MSNAAMSNAAVTSPISANPTEVLRGRAGSPALVGALTGYAGFAMFVAAACSTYLGVRAKIGVGEMFVSPAMHFNNYVAVMITLTLLLASVAAGWAVTSMRVGQRRWSTSGFGLAMFLNLAAANLLWFLVKDLGFGASGTTYEVLLFGLFIVAGVALVIGFASSLSGLLRTLSGQATASQPHYGVLSAWGQHLAAASWVAIYATIYLLK